MLPTLLVLILFMFPAMLAWNSMQIVQEKNNGMRESSQALFGLHRFDSSLQQAIKNEDLIAAGHQSEIINFTQANEAMSNELASLNNVVTTDPELKWLEELGNETAKTNEVFKNELLPASTAMAQDTLRSADEHLRNLQTGMKNTLDRLVQLIEMRSNETAFAANTTAHDNIFTVIISMAFAAIIGLASVLILARRTAIPARELSRAALALSEGNLGNRVTINGHDELAQLGRAFNDMATSLEIRDEALLAEQGKLRSVHQSITDGIIVTGNNGFLISANPAAEAILNKTEAALAGSRKTGIKDLDQVLDREILVDPSNMVHCWEVQRCGHEECPSFGSEDLRCWLQCSTHCHDEIQGTFAKKRDACERCHVFRVNSCVNFNADIGNSSYAISVAPILNDDGMQEGRIAVLHDITEERNRSQQLGLLYEIANCIAINTDVEESLNTSLELCANAIKASSGSIMLASEDGKLVLTADSGISRKNIMRIQSGPGEEIAAWVLERGEPVLLTNFHELSQSEFSANNVRDMICLPIKGENGVAGVLTLYNRQTKEGFTRENLDFLSPVAVQIGMALSRKRLYEKVAREKEKQTAIFESMGESLCVKGPDRTIQFANPVHKKLFGDDCIGKPCYEVYVGRDSTCGGCPLDRCFNTGDTVRRSHYVLDREGEIHQLEATTTPVRNSNGTITSCIEISRDVTEMLQIQDQAESRLKTLTTLFDVSNTLSSSLELSHILDNLSASTLGVLNASSVAIMLFEDNRLLLRSVAGKLNGWSIKIGDEIDIAGYGFPKFVSGVAPFCAAVPDGKIKAAIHPMAPPGSKSILMGSLSTRGKLLGLISVSSNKKASFSEPGQMELFVDITNQASVAIDNLKMYKQLEETFWSTIRSLAEAIDAKDTYTRGHSDRVAEYAGSLARRLQLAEDMQNAVRCAGYLHDTGKIGIPDSILLKPGKLSEEEFELIMRHPVLSHKIIEPVQFPYDVKPIVRHHHERIDGKGYPDGLAGDEIPLGARIVCIADAFEAMTSDRPYRKALSKTDAIKELLRWSGKQFDANLVPVFVDLLDESVEEEEKSHTKASGF